VAIFGESIVLDTVDLILLILIERYIYLPSREARFRRQAAFFGPLLILIWPFQKYHANSDAEMFKKLKTEFMHFEMYKLQSNQVERNSQGSIKGKMQRNWA